MTYFAQHEFLNHPCVVKILPHRVRDASDSAVRRLRHEAQAGFRVNDPHVVRVLDCDALEGLWYFVTEYVDGMDLAELIRAGVRLQWQHAVAIARGAASGLAAIHRAGLIHRDIKPANLLLGTDGDVRVTDLGVAGLAQRSRDAASAAPRERAGTLDYAAPETFEADAAIGVTADLYSLGATIYHVLAGRPPYAHESVYTTLMHAHNRVPAWPEDAPSDLPDWLRNTLLRLLANDASDRFPSAEALFEHLTLPGAPPTALVLAPPPAPALQPRGLAVLPFENELTAPADDWLGFALADALSRELAKSPGVYVADQEQLRSLLSRQRPPPQGPSSQALLAAGRLVGAATIVSGRFSRAADSIRFSADVHRRGHDEPARIGPVEGMLSKLAELQATLFQRLTDLLRISPSPAATGRAPAMDLETREKFTRGKQAYLQGDYETAIRLARDALQADPDLIEAVQYMSACYARLGRYEEATRYHDQLAKLAAQRGDAQLLVEARANMGVMHYFRGEYATAHEHYSEAAELAEKHDLTTERAQVYNNDGFALFRLGQPQQAQEAFHRAVEIFRQFGALARLVGPYNGLGNVMAEQQRYDDARDYYRRALTLAQEIGNRTNTGVSHMHLGRCASLRGHFSDAKNEFALALNTLEGTSFWNALARTYEYMAEMNLRLGHYSEAVRCADKRIELARRHSNWTMEADAWRQKAGALGKMGYTDEADACLKRADDIASGRAAANS